MSSPNTISLSNLNNAQIHLVVLVLAIVGTYYVYTEYIYIVAPIFIAISLYYSSNENITYFVNNLSPDLNNFIIKNKMYLVYGFIGLSIYMGLQNKNQNSGTTNNKLSEYSTFSSDSSF